VIPRRSVDALERRQEIHKVNVVRRDRNGVASANWTLLLACSATLPGAIWKGVERPAVACPSFAVVGDARTATSTRDTGCRISDGPRLGYLIGR
jgi:hypothetical protein